MNDRLPTNVGCFRMDTILFHSMEIHCPTHSRDNPILFATRISHYLWVFALSFLAGCAQPKSTQPTEVPQTAIKDRPPLHVWLIDAPELEKEISNRWQSSSDQPITVHTTDSSKLTQSLLGSVDIVIYPANLIGGLIGQGTVGKLPAQYTQTRDIKSEERISDWPVRWRNVATYGGQLYAVPLGAPPLGAIANNVDPSPIAEIEKSLSTSKLSTEASLAQWNLFLGPIEKSRNLKLAVEQLDTRLDSLSDAEKNRLVDSFLWLASTTDARRKGLFDLHKMHSRIHQPEFVATGKLLARIIRVFPNGILSDANNAWSELLNASSNTHAIAIGYPNSVAESASNNPQLNATPVVLPWLWNNESGLIASVAKNTRQTAVSCSFLEWLSSSEQRAALRLLTSRIELLPSQSDRSVNRSDSRDYQSLLSRPHFNHGMDLSLRFDQGTEYRKRLALALVQVIRAPENAEVILAECSTDWNKLIEKLGTDKQRVSIEQSLGLSK